MITSGEATGNGLFVVVAHSNKTIRHAIRFAVSRGWIVIKAGPRAHIWGSLLCPHRQRDGCRIRV